MILALGEWWAIINCKEERETPALLIIAPLSQGVGLNMVSLLFYHKSNNISYTEKRLFFFRKKKKRKENKAILLCYQLIKIGSTSSGHGLMDTDWTDWLDIHWRISKYLYTNQHNSTCPDSGSSSVEDISD